MLLEAGIFIVGCVVIGYICYREIKNLNFDIMVKRSGNGKDIKHFPKFKEFEGRIKDMTREIIGNYEEMKSDKKYRKKKNNKDDNMYQ